jgi:hypothetical protein
MELFALLCLLFVQDHRPRIVLDKKAYRYGQAITVHVATAHMLGAVGYLNLEHYYNGRWYTLDDDIQVHVLNAVSPQPLRPDLRVVYRTTFIEKIRLGKAPEKCRFVLVYGPDFHHCETIYDGQPFLLAP